MTDSQLSEPTRRGGLSRCPASVGIQVRAFALQATGAKPAGSARGADATLDASRGLARDRETGELLEKEPPQGRGRRIER